MKHHCTDASCHFPVVKHHDQMNLKTKMLNLAYDFTGLRVHDGRAKGGLRARIVIYNHKLEIKDCEL